MEPRNVVIKTQDSQFEIKIEPQCEKLIQSLFESSNELDPSNYVIKLDKENKQVKLIAKEEILNGKSDLEELNHPFFSELHGKTDIKLSKEILVFEKNEKIIIFSPHPDDEILGSSGLLYDCFLNKIDIKVIYMTSGKSAGGYLERQIEAINGIKILGGSEENCIFACFPFYNRLERNIEEDDFEYAREYLRKHSPSTIFICADVFDPNKTHRKCFDVLIKVIGEEEFSSLSIFFYYSVWYWPCESEYTHILPYSYETYKHKIYAMLEHKSQLENKFMGNDPRPFYQRAIARDSYFGKIHKYEYCEVYYQVHGIK